MGRFKSEINGYQLLALMDPAGTFPQTHPHTFPILQRLQAANLRITEVNFYEHSVWIGLGIGANLLVYDRRRKVLVQGAIWEFGIWGEKLKRLLPPNTIWQARVK